MTTGPQDDRYPAHPSGATDGPGVAHGPVATGIAPARTDPFAIASLVCGVLGLSIVAVVLGHLALSRLRHGGAGRGLAIAGLVLGYLGVLAGVLFLVSAVFLVA